MTKNKRPVGRPKLYKGPTERLTVPKKFVSIVKIVINSLIKNDENKNKTILEKTHRPF